MTAIDNTIGQLARLRDPDLRPVSIRMIRDLQIIRAVLEITPAATERDADFAGPLLPWVEALTRPWTDGKTDPECLDHLEAAADRLRRSREKITRADRTEPAGPVRSIATLAANHATNETRQYFMEGKIS